MTEADENARYNIAILLGKNLVEFPENRTVLNEVMRTERSKRIRLRVAALLSEP